MKRNLMQQLVSWKERSDRKPLLLKGVRQTGKTYLLDEFGRDHFANCHRINFEKQQSVRTIFEKDLEPRRIIDELSFFLNNSIDIANDLVVFDEIQACPKALTSLKYFCEDLPELALCGAGSLLGLHLADGSYPVGKVDMMNLYPMLFSEFLQGVGDQKYVQFLEEFRFHKNIPQVVHQHLWMRLKHYFITGGLPEVVSIFAAKQDNLYEAFLAVRKKQSELIEGYFSDIAKHAEKVNALHIDRTWHSVPNQLSRTQDGGMKRFKFKGIIPRVNRYAQLADVIDWLQASELVIKTPIVETVRDPLSAYTKENIFRLFMFDIGILGAMSDLAPKTILDYEYGSYKGYFAENYVAQQLKASLSTNLFSWQEGRAEVEFLIKYNAGIVPLEVKSGKTVKAQSLTKFIEKYSPLKSFILSANNFAIDSGKNKIYLPLYCVEKLGGKS